MKQERQLVEKILRALLSIDVSSLRTPDLSGSKTLPKSPASTGRTAKGWGALRGAVGVRLGPGDDAAILSSSGRADFVLSCDAFIEGTHFHLLTHPPQSVGYKSLARATSDLAAMGASPRYFLLTLALPKRLTASWLTGFLRGMARASREIGIRVVGGDVTTATTVSISITVVGEVTRGAAVLRSGARPGDHIYVSGKLGPAQLGLELVLAREAANPKFRTLVQPHLYPKIQTELGFWLARHRLATAMMDISDGLSTDLARLCYASHVGAQLDAEKIPRVTVPDLAAKKLVKRQRDPLEMALHGGDDYELLFTVSPSNEKKLQRAPNFSDCVAIGEITAARKLQLLDGTGKILPLEPRGWDPF